MTTKKKDKLLFEVGNRIRLLRESKGISQQDLAAQCNFEKSNLSRLEAGNTNPTIRTLHKISNALGVTLSDLVNIPGSIEI